MVLFSRTSVSKVVCHEYKIKYFKMTLSPVQQHLFSYFNLTKVSSLKSLLEVLKEINTALGIDESPTPEELKEEVLRINKVIKQFDLEITETVDEITCEEVFVIVNTADNAITQKSKFYDENTSQLFSKIVTNCVLSEKGNISETACLNLSSPLKMTKSAVQSILEKLIADKWLVSVNDKISLGMRSIAELEQNIKQHYPDEIVNCPFCKLFVIQGFICNNCRVKSHLACLKKYLKLSKSNCLCPQCKTVWQDIPPHLNNDAVEPAEEDLTCGAGPSKKKKKQSYV